MTEEFLHRFAVDWLRAWNSHDTEQVFALLDEDVVWDDRVFWPDVIHGKDELRSYMDKIWQAMPDVAWTEIERFVNPDRSRGLVLFEQTGGAPAAFGTDRRFRSHGCDIFLSFSGDRLAHYLGAYDIVGMLEQLGAIPPRGTRTGSGYVMSLLRSGS
ncbi:nuclear transport factor 2 family protein [Pseudonocardia endophytica]|uniref:Steroid delta-isomerase-like uncharacterized protein n=1 Tax=Pseudonocardia endophytica TaxID=401976 RepID=A0A4R1HN91_PSEEN|nr:nuclear transport factor 2 family protein [Pseudonocardia endophytica]TCK21139.1 steroid delta-isomerase-like uncharacterized protein [Pseudonocardia endophytica]